MNEDATGAMPAGQRFSNMEATLMRIESKLDGKLDHSDLEPVIRRVELLEAGETPLGKVMLTQFTTMQQRVSDLAVHVADGETRRAVSEKNSERVMRVWGIALTFAATLAVLISSAAAVITVLAQH